VICFSKWLYEYFWGIHIKHSNIHWAYKFPSMSKFGNLNFHNVQDNFAKKKIKTGEQWVRGEKEGLAAY